jgi:hypothetical protein
MHGFAEFVRFLREEGFDAEPLKESTKAKSAFSKDLLTN